MDDYLSVSLLPNSPYAIMKANRSNMLGAGISNNKVKYSRLAADDDGYIDLQVRGLFVDIISDVSCCSMDRSGAWGTFYYLNKCDPPFVSVLCLFICQGLTRYSFNMIF